MYSNHTEENPFLIERKNFNYYILIMLKSCNFMKAFLSSHEQSSVTRNGAKLMVTDKQFKRNSTSFQDDDNGDARCQTMIICH